jgi:tetratricopeptide (TPR) repeat protein
LFFSSLVKKNVFLSVSNVSVMKIKIVTLISIFFLSFFSKGQSDKTTIIDKRKASQFITKGKALYDLGQIKTAYMEFKSAIEKNPASWEAYYWLANTEFELNNFFSASENAEIAHRLTDKKNDADLNFLLGKIMHNLGKIEAALSYYKVTQKSLGENLAKEYDIPILISQCYFVKNEITKGVVNKRTLFSNKLNTEEDEYCPILTGDGSHVFFTSRRAETTGDNQNPEDQKFFEDIYHFEWNSEENDWRIPSQSLEGINTDGFDALNYISRNGKYALGTINTSASKEKTTRSSDIFEITTDEEFLFESISIINNKNINTSYFDGAAVISDTIYSEDNNFSQILYFVSDRDGEKSLTDIYCIEKKNGVWIKNKTKLKNINTLGRETTPFISSNGKFLFFSSDGLPGMGGYDIYYSENKSGTWGPPINLGAAFNTVNDDTHFQVYPHLKKAVQAGINETNGLFNYDIFQIDLSDSDFPFLRD